jgi:hypothetical protein
METNLNKRMKTKLLILLSTLFFCLPLYSQLIPGRQNIVQLDSNFRVLQPEALPLEESIPMEEGINNSLFLSGVGGVSFDKVALPATNLTVSTLRMNYNKFAEDGSRLELSINNKSIEVNLPDWLLIPIAKYAESPYYSCVTIFGKLKDKTLEKKVIEHKGRVINYHPSFENTLLGIRLAYMDMLVGYPFANDLPRNSLGSYILGYGETQPDLDANQNGAYYLSQHFIRVQNKYNQTFRSYVISDFSREIKFDIRNDSLIIEGFPYFYCWKYNSDHQNYDINEVAETISAKYNKQLGELSVSTGNQTPKGWMVDKLISISNKYNGKYGFYSEGTFVDLVKLKTDEEKRDFLFKYDLQSLFQLVVSTEAYMDRDSIVYLKEYSDEVSSKPEIFKAANPAVFDATVNTMRFAAFFRYIKTNYSLDWKAFVDQVSEVDPEPRITTPTIMYDPNIKEIEQAVKIH